MCIRSFLAICILAVSCSSKGTSTSDPDNTSSAIPTSVAPAISEFVEAMNLYRKDKGCGVLTWDASIASVAQAHSEDMIARVFFDHTNPDGKSAFQRLSDARVNYAAAAENIAAGTTRGKDILAIWLASSGHRSTIENCGYTLHGVGMKNGTWTHVFVR